MRGAGINAIPDSSNSFLPIVVRGLQELREFISPCFRLLKVRQLRAALSKENLARDDKGIQHALLTLCQRLFPSPLRYLQLLPLHRRRSMLLSRRPLLLQPSSTRSPLQPYHCCRCPRRPSRPMSGSLSRLTKQPTAHICRPTLHASGLTQLNHGEWILPDALSVLPCVVLQAQRFRL